MEEFISLADAAKKYRIHPDYLRFLVLKNRLVAVKIGRNWATTASWVEDYLQARGTIRPRINPDSSHDIVKDSTQPDFRRTLAFFMVGLSTGAFAIYAGFHEMNIENPPDQKITKSAVQILPDFETPIYSIITRTHAFLNSTRSQIAISPKETQHFALLKSDFNSFLSSLRLPKLSLSAFSLAPLYSYFSELFKSSPPSEIAISQNPSSPPFENLSSTAIEEGRLGATPPFRKGRLGGIATPPFRKGRLGGIATPPFEKGRLGGISLPGEVRPLASEVRLPEEIGLQRVNEITRIVERRQTLIPVDLAAVKSSLLSDLQSLNQSLKNEITQDLSSLRSLYSRLSSENQSQTRVITLTQKIDTLGSATLSNITFSGTGNQFNLKDADIPDDITVSGAQTFSNLTVTSALTSNSAATSTYSGGIQATTLNITSTTATSTFANGLQLSGGCFRTSTGTCLTPASPGGGSGAIQFNSSSAFTGDENNLVWDNTLKRLGLSTTTPASLLSVQGNTQISGTSTQGAIIATSTLFVGTNGNLFNVLQNGFAGIGTTSPGSLLSVHGGNLQVTGTTTASGLVATSTLFVGSNGNLFNVLQSGLVGIATTSPSSLLSIHGNTLISGTTTQGALIATSTLYVGSSGQRLLINESGNIGIGTTSPSSLLSIQGIGNFVSAATSTLYTTLSLPNLYSTSTIATSTFAGSLYVASSTPTQNALFAVGTSSPLLYIDRNTGRLGVGTSSPGLAFSVGGDILGSGILNLTGTGTSTISGGLNIGTLNITSTTATSTFGNGIQLSSGGVRFPDGRTQSSAPVFVRKTADETVNNSTTLQDDDALFLAMAANETWYFTLNFAHTGNSTADFKLSFTIPAGATMRWNCTGTKVGTAGTLEDCTSITSSGSAATLNGQAGDAQFLVSGVVTNGGTAGNLQLQWAQNTATAVDTKVLTNSYLEAHK